MPRSQKCAELRFVEDSYPELLCFIQLGARGFARENVVGIFRDGAGHLAAVSLDEGFEMIADVSMLNWAAQESITKHFNTNDLHPDTLYLLHSPNFFVS